MSEATAYAFWQNALDGKKQPVHENEPHAGFWYMRKKGMGRVPVATWYDGGELIALVGFHSKAQVEGYLTGPRTDDPQKLWTWICQHPVTEDVYRKAFASGRWPDDPPPVYAPTSDNEPRPNTPEGDPASAINEELAGEAELAEQFLASPIETKEAADRAAVWAKRVSEIAKRADEKRKVEKEPHLRAGREVDAKWSAIIDAAKALTARLKKHVEPFLIAEKRKEDERRRQAEEEAARLREQASASDQQSESERAALIQQAQEAEKAAAPKSSAAGRTGAKVSLRTEKRAKIVDWDACYQALKDHPDMKALVEQLANRAVRAGVPLAGVEVETYEKAA